MCVFDPRARVSAACLAIAVAGCATGGESLAIAPRAFTDADSSVTTTIAPGVTHTFVRDARGPWAIHIVEVEARRCEPVLEARRPGSRLDDRATTSMLASDALAAINADFFMLPGGTPVGAHVTGGVPLIGPTDRPVFGVTSDGWSIGTAHVAGHAHVRTDSAAVVQINRPGRAFSAYRGTGAGITLFTARIGDSVPADSAARFVVVRMLDGDEAAGSGVVTVSDSTAAAVPVRQGTAVLLALGVARDWARRRAPGDTVSWSTSVVTDAAVTEAVGGFPELLRDGRIVLDQQVVAESFGDRRHPRTAIGWTPDRRLLLVAVDGRQPAWSDGMSLDELAWLFQGLGASHALNLDGGGSTAVVVNGAVVNRPSDREGERAVGNALALARCRP